MTPTNPTPVATPQSVVPEALRLADEAKRDAEFFASDLMRAHRGSWTDTDADPTGKRAILFATIDALAALAQRPAATPLVQEAEPVAMPAGWVPCTITYEEGEDPEEVAFGPQRMMDRLKKWLDAYFAKVYAERYPVATGVQATEVARDPHAHWIPSADGLSRRNPAPDASVAMVPNSRTVMLKKMSAEVASPVVGALPDGVDEALQRLIENSAIQGPASRDDAMLVARYCRRLATPSQQEDAQPVAAVFRQGDAASLRWLIGAIPPAHDTLLYTRAAPPARSSVPQWQPIETAPKDGTDVLLWREDCGQFIGCYATPDFFPLTQEQLDALSEEELSSHDWFAQWPDARRLDGPDLPTRWMPLPDEPVSPQSPQEREG